MQLHVANQSIMLLYKPKQKQLVAVKQCATKESRLNTIIAELCTFNMTG